MVGSGTSIRLLRTIAFGLALGSFATHLFAVDPFRFEPSNQAATLLNEVEVQRGLPEGFDRKELVAAIGGQEHANALIGWISFGDVQSRSVALLLTDEAPRRLFVDLDRNRKLTSTEMIVAEKDDSNVWLLDLDAEFVPKEAETYLQRQQLRIRYWEAGDRLTISASGSMTGVVEFAGQERLAKYVDRDSNGRWFDADDRLFVDFNSDGKLDRLLERVPCQGMRKIAGQLYAISGDRAGRWLKIDQVNDRGSLVPIIKLADPLAKVVSLDASIASSSGTQVRVTALNVPVEVPVGTWNVIRLQITVQGESGTYSFDFASSNRKTNPVVIKRDATSALDLLGELKITVSKTTRWGSDGAIRLITPVLRSDSGLFLTNSRRGKLEVTNENRLTVLSFSKNWSFVHRGSTGFT